MSENKIVRLGSDSKVVPHAEVLVLAQDKSEAALTKKAETIIPAEKSESEVLAEKIGTLEQGIRGERELGERAFALTTFFNHGGQELVSKFGSTRVLDTLSVLGRDDTAPKVSIFELIKQLEPNKEKRSAVYSEMEEMSRASLAKKEDEERRLAMGKDADAHKEFTRLYDDLHRGKALGVEVTMNACRTLDRFMGGVFATNEKHTLRFGLSDLHTDALNGGGEKLKTILESQEVSGDLLVAIDRINKEREIMRETRMKQAAEMMGKLEAEISKIIAVEEAELAAKMNPILVDLQQTLEKHGGSETGEKILSSIAETVQKELTKMKEATAKVIDQKTSDLKKQLARLVTITATR